MIKSNTERFIGEFNDNKFERKNCISKICGMSILRYCAFISFILLATFKNASAETKTTDVGQLRYIKLSNGLNCILMPSAQANGVELNFEVEVGSINEPDSINGIANLTLKIISNKIATSIKNGRGILSAQNTTFSSVTTSERSVFKFTTSAAYIGACFSLVKDSMYRAKITVADINKARNIILQQIEEAKRDKQKIFEDKLSRAIFIQDHQKLNILGIADELSEVDRTALLTFFNRYYATNNTLCTITGNFLNPDVESTFENSFKDVVKSEFDPQTITRIVDHKPIVYNTQFVVEDSAGLPEFQICWQFPGTNNNFHESYSAFLINAMLNDKNNFIQVKLAKMGCKKFTVQYDANNFSGVLRLTFQPSRENLFATYNFVITEMGRLNQTLLNDVMIKAAKIQFKREYETLKKSKEYPVWIINHWTFNNESYFPELLDSVMNLTPNQIEKFVIGYLNQSAHVSGLKISKADRMSLMIDTAFTDLDQNVAKYVFTYAQNVTSIEGNDNKVKLQNLLQWLKANPDISVQVNGLSDEHEFYKATDEDSILQFIDSMPNFQKVTSEVIKKKRTIRPEMARAVKIVKYLYEHGIPSDRLSGTAMKFKSSTKQEAADNMRCTLTLNKIHTSPSLYEYHYGKKKE